MDYDAAMPELSERSDGFAYRYLMRCSCGGVSPISAENYYAEMTRQAHMPCRHCHGTIHFGPAVAALRDPSDPALDNEQINRLAWYHTSKTAVWPSPTYANDHRAALEEMARRFRLHPEHAVEPHLDKALHVGTYEAAIEIERRAQIRRISSHNKSSANCGPAGDRRLPGLAAVRARNCRCACVPP